MSPYKTQLHRLLYLAAALTLLTAYAASAAIEIIDASYRPDRRLPQWDIFWKNAWKWGDETVPVYPSGALAIYLKNTGTGSVTVSDLTINGAGLANGIRCSSTAYSDCNLKPCSVYYPSTNWTLVNAGEPIWWKVDPNPIPAGGTAEAYVRMRSMVETTLSVVVQSNAGDVSASIAVSSANRPRVAGCCFSYDATKAYLYLRHPTKGKVPTAIYMDGRDITASCTVVGDPDVDLVAVCCNLGSALPRGSYHCFKANYDDGTNACDGLRVYADNFKYGKWSLPDIGDDDYPDHITDMARHSLNLQVFSNIAKDATCRALMAQYGIDTVNSEPYTYRLYGLFLCDEIDAREDFSCPTSVVPAQIGGFAQDDWTTYAKPWKDNWPAYPTIQNLNATYKPYNYYIYGHLADILSVDPYYAQRIRDAYWTYPNLQPLYSKATYIHAVASTCQAACEPNPLHVILSIFRNDDGTRVFRFNTPEEKRIEAYYAIAAGAKQLSYWWMSPSNGIGRFDEPPKVALWREVGLIGAELGMVGDIITNSAPAVFDIAKPGKLWVKPLLHDLHTIMLVCVNDDYSCIDSGTFIRPIANANVSFDLPGWLTSPTHVFDVTYRGVSDVPNSIAGGRISLSLGRFDVTRLVIITKDSALKSALQSHYTNTYGPRVQELIPLP
jgi:hypothetical protein